MVRILTLGAAALALAGCLRASPVRPAEPPPIRLHVTSESAGPVELYVLRGSTRTRLGTVRPWTTARFVLPRVVTAAGAPIQLAADPLGSRTAVVADVGAVSQGQEIVWTLVDPLRLSVASIRVR